MTFDFHENELKMSQFLTDRLAEIVQEMGAQQIVKQPRTGPYDITQYQTTHTCGGAIMGADPRTSALNRYLQSWDVPNLFVHRRDARFRRTPATTRPALSARWLIWAADAIRNQYLKNPGPLVHA